LWSIAFFLGLLALVPASGGTPAQTGLPRKAQPRFDDLDKMIERRMVRVLLPYNRLLYFFEGAQARGATYELMMEFETFLNKKFRPGARKIHVLVIPTPRDRLLSAITEGLGDIAAGNLTITPQRRQSVDFSDSLGTGVREIIVTGPKAPTITTIEELAGREVHVRASSSYYESLDTLNQRFRDKGLAPVRRVAVSEYLEDEDLLEMVAAGLINVTVVDSHKAEFWSSIHQKARFHHNLSIREDGRIGWAFRSGSPQLKQAVNEFVRIHKKGTLMGNILLKRYLKDNQWIRNALAEKEWQRLEEARTLMRKYAEQYGFDWLMIAALAFQESGIDQSKRSRHGAVGVMQILPSTAADKNVGVPDIHIMENNIHAGVKYLDFLRQRYFSGDEMSPVDRTLMTFASYNAGPARVSQLRAEAARSGLDPDVWFQNVEMIAARRIGRETVHYVANIFKYYIGYRLAFDQAELRQTR
jgi:membrane-bound lytic murein transglycosylase MltF